MQSNKLIVNGVDVFDAFGIYIPNGGYNSLITYAPSKKIKFNDWHEENGIEIFNNNVKLDKKIVHIQFISAKGRDGLLNFFDFLSCDNSYSLFYFKSIDRKYKLRIKEFKRINGCGDLFFAQIEFLDDFPFLDNYVYNNPLSNIIENDKNKIYQNKLSDYGVIILDGTTNEILFRRKIRENLLKDASNKNGVFYDSNFIRYENKDIIINCLMRADNLQEFWNNYDALLFDLCRNDLTPFWFGDISVGFYGRYKYCTVYEFITYEKIWFKFSLKITFVK